MCKLEDNTRLNICKVDWTVTTTQQDRSLFLAGKKGLLLLFLKKINKRGIDQNVENK